MFHIVRWMDWEHDAKYTVSMITYELSLIIQDAVLFFHRGPLVHSLQCRSFGLDRVACQYLQQLHYVLSFQYSATP
jgi:hypothetical protein